MQDEVVLDADFTCLLAEPLSDRSANSDLIRSFAIALPWVHQIWVASSAGRQGTEVSSVSLFSHDERPHPGCMGSRLRRHAAFFAPGEEWGLEWLPRVLPRIIRLCEADHSGPFLPALFQRAGLARVRANGETTISDGRI